MYFFQFPEACNKFEVVVKDAGQQKFEGNVVLRDKLNFSDAQFYQLVLVATVRIFIYFSELLSYLIAAKSSLCNSIG